MTAPAMGRHSEGQTCPDLAQLMEDALKLICTYDCLMDFGSGPELVKRGQEIEPRATVAASRDEVARYMARRGEAVPPDVWAKRKPEADAKWNAAQVLTAQHRAETEAWKAKRAKAMGK